MAGKSDGHDTSAAARTWNPAEEPYSDQDPPMRKDAHHAVVWAIFQQWDPTRRGMIRKEELLSTFSGLGLHMGERELSLMLQSADMSGDESVHYGKFLRWIFAPASSSESSHQADVSSHDVQTELNISEPNGLSLKRQQDENEDHETEVQGLRHEIKTLDERTQILNADAEPENEFQQKAKLLRKRIASALRRAADAHHATIDLEIARVLQRREARLFEPTAADGGEAMLQTLLQRLPTQRWRIAQELESLLEEVKSTLLLRDAEPTGSGSDVDELVAERLELDIQLIARETVLLRASGALDEVPWSVVKALATFSGIILPRDGKEEQFPMHWAADHGRRDIMEFLLRYPAGEDLLLQRDSQGRIPLFYAERAGNDALALYLQEHGPDLHPQEPTLQRPSSANIPAAYEDVIKVVEERGWHAVNWIEGFTLLHWAAEKGLADFCRYFVALNADPNATDSRGRTALLCATDSNHRDAELVLRELMGLELSDGNRTTSKESYSWPRSNSEGPESSHWPTQSQRACVPAVRQNLSQSWSSDEIPEAYLRVIQQIDQIGWHKMCWGRGFTLLHWAAKHDRADLCELFLRYGADPGHRDESNRSAFDYARLRQPQALAALEVLQRGGDILQAAREGNVGAVRRLLQVDPQSLEKVDEDGRGPLTQAAAHGHLEVVQALLAAGASIEAKDRKGWVPLAHAAWNGHLEVVRALLAAGASVEAKNDDGRTPLQRAAFNGHAAVVERLLAAGAAVDAVDSVGRTPLHWAGYNDHGGVVERLLAAGAAVDAVDNEGRTPYDLAKKEGHRKVMGVLDPVFVAFLSGRSCRCNSAHETVQDLKEEAERKLETSIEHLIGPDMQPLNGAMTLQEANILPGNTLTAVLDPVVLKDFGHGISMRTAQSVFDEYGPKIDVLEDWKDLRDPSSLQKVLPPGHVALSQLLRLSPEDVAFPKPVEVEMPTCVGAESVWRSSAAGWEPLGAKFSDGRVVVALSHFCDLVATGPCGLKAVGFIDPNGANAKVALLHVACESCQNSLEQLCSDADMLGSFKRCGPSVPLGTYRHDEELQLRQGQETTNLKVRFHRMPQVSRKLVAHSASRFDVEIEGDDHQFEELWSAPAPSAPSDLQSAPATSQAIPAAPAAMTSDATAAQQPERGHLLLSGRFNSDTIINYMKAVKRRLEDRGVPVYMVQAQVGQSFAELTRIGLGRAKGMVAFCTSEYGAYTGAGYETFHELEYAHDNHLYIFPIRLCEQWPPAPRNNARGTFQNRLVFKNGLVYVADQQMSNAEGTADNIADSVTSSGIFAT